MMMWMWISSIVVLLGAELDAGIEHQTERAARRARRRQTGGVEYFCSTAVLREAKQLAGAFDIIIDERGQVVVALVDEVLAQRQVL